jgi:hypothetical protein
VFVDVVLLVGGGEHLALVDEVDAERFQDARLLRVADAAFGHHRNGHHGADSLDHLDRCHARHAAFAADVGRHPLERHHRRRARLLRDARLLGVRHVHESSRIGRVKFNPRGTISGQIDRPIGHNWPGRRSGVLDSGFEFWILSAKGDDPCRPKRALPREPRCSRS